MGVEAARLYARRSCLTCLHFLPASLEPPFRGYCMLLRLSLDKPREGCPNYTPSITAISPPPELSSGREKEERRIPI